MTPPIYLWFPLPPIFEWGLIWGCLFHYEKQKCRYRRCRSALLFYRHFRPTALRQLCMVYSGGSGLPVQCCFPTSPHFHCRLLTRTHCDVSPDFEGCSPHGGFTLIVGWTVFTTSPEFWCALVSTHSDSCLEIMGKRPVLKCLPKKPI